MFQILGFIFQCRCDDEGRDGSEDDEVRFVIEMLTASDVERWAPPLNAALARLQQQVGHSGELDSPEHGRSAAKAIETACTAVLQNASYSPYVHRWLQTANLFVD